MRGNLRIVKTFEGKENPIAGVPFLIVGQTAFGEIRMEAKTGKDGVLLLEGLPVGKYTVTELESELTKGYVLAAAQGVTIEDGKTAEIKIENKLQRGSLKIVKTFEGRKDPMEGVPFLIVGQTAIGEIRKEVRTDEKGVILLENLPVGSYTVAEQKSELNAGYVLSTARIVSVTAGKETVVNILNKLIVTDEPEPPEKPKEPEPDEPVYPGKPGEPLPKTGDSKAIVWCAAAIGGLACVGAGYMLLKRRKDTDEFAEV